MFPIPVDGLAPFIIIRPHVMARSSNWSSSSSTILVQSVLSASTPFSALVAKYQSAVQSLLYGMNL